MKNLEAARLGEIASLKRDLTEAQGALTRLRWGVVANAGVNQRERRPRWAWVKDATGYGSTAALSGANLRGADLYDANLRGANLRGADLRDADLSGANLSSADLARVYRNKSDPPILGWVVRRGRLVRKGSYA